MKKNLIIICNLACLICFFIVLLGCDQPASEPATPKVVRKKIRERTDQKAPAPKAQTVKRSQPLPKSKPATEPSAPSEQTPAAQKPVLAKKSAPPVVKTGRTAKAKPPVKPKSDISVIQASKPRAVGDKTATSKPTTTSTTQSAIAKSSSKDRPIYNPKDKSVPFEPLFRD